MSMDSKPRGCLAFIFGFGGETTSLPISIDSKDPSSVDEGNIHSGPAGYEGMGYSGGYAAEYFSDSDGFNEGDANH